MNDCLIQTFDNFLPQKDLEDCYKLCDEAENYATIGPQRVKDTSIRNTCVLDWDRLYEVYPEKLERISSFFWGITESYLSNLHPVEDTKSGFFQQTYKLQLLNFLKYKSGGFYKSHCDEGFIGTSSSNFLRQVSYVLFVNENFSGGGLYFNNMKKKINPKTNRLVIFPSNWSFPHQVLPVLQGVRRTVVTWGGFVL